MILYLFQSSVVLSLFYLAYFFFLKENSAFKENRFFLLTGLAFSLLLPGLPLNFSKVKTEYVYLNENLANSIAFTPTEVTQNPTYWEGLGWSEIFLIVYLFGVFVFLLMFIYQVYSVLLIIRKGEKIQHEGLNLIVTSESIGPFSFFNYIIINPELYDGEDLNYILTHEKIHVRQKHQFDLLLAESVKILLWFFPLAWYYKKSLQNNLEYLTDRESLKTGLNRKTYQILLLNLSQFTGHSSAVNHFSKTLIKNRIKMMNKSREITGFKTRYFLSYSFLIILTVGFGVKVQSNNAEVERIIVWVRDAEQNTTNTDIHNEDLKASKEKESIQDEFIEINIQPIAPSFESKSPLDVSSFTNAIKDSLKKIKPNELKEIETKEIDGEIYYILKYNNGEKNDTLMAKGKAKDLKSLFKNKNREKLELLPEGFFKQEDDYSGYHKLLPNWEGGVYKKNKSEILPYEFPNIPEGRFRVPGNIHSFKIDSLWMNDKELILKNGVIEFNLDSLRIAPIIRGKADSLIIQRSKNNVSESVSEIKLWQNDKTGRFMIPAKAFENGKEPLIIIEGEVSNLEKLKEYEGREGYEIIYMPSSKLMQEYGQKTKDGIIIVTKSSKRKKNKFKVVVTD